MTDAALVIRADASTQIGSGHVMRCLALAQAWQEQGGTVAFVADVPVMLQDRLQAEGMTVHALVAPVGSWEDAHQVIDVAQALCADHVVIDGYEFGADYQQWIKQSGLRLLVLDDNGHADHYYADFVLNQNIHANEEMYSNREPYTQLLLGTHYVLLRREFWPWRGWRREIPGIARKVLISMGGGDPDNVTLTVLHALERVSLDNLHVKVVVGGSNPHYEALQLVALQSRHRIELARDVTDMPALMAWADVAVSAGGSTCWELTFMGLPSAIIVLAENQRAVAERLAQQGVMSTLGWHVDISPGAIASALTRLVEDSGKRRAMSVRARDLIDSRGGERVVRVLRHARFHLRLATPGDCRLVFDWANELSIREVSFSSDFIPWETHVAWFERTLKNENELFWIAENGMGEPIGQVRFALENNEATISISLDRACRGKGWGSALIEQGSWLVLDRHGIDVVHAYIKTGNVASEKAFAKAGYSLAQPIEINGQPAIHLTLKKL